ncbi:phospholipase A1-IIgamma [Ziziphus jujuba]|uniref:Phospholipase A1 n=1 Tax=Ziziphus jujuba TaxID=326968 RepID=A0A6P4AIZ9_ZIZJJ|nr:phospholipase A1-IIgamma [Ziziphus jujuba]
MASKTIPWRELNGESKWTGLLEYPLNPELGDYLTHYCKMIEPIMDFFDKDNNSETLGLSRVDKKDLLNKAGLSKFYTVEEYLFASTKNIRMENDTRIMKLKSGYSNWMGYVAVSKDQGKAKFGRRDIVIAIRATIKQEEWFIKYCLNELVPANEIFGHDHKLKPKLHKGRYEYYITEDHHKSGYNSISFRNQVLDAVKELVAKYQGEEISITVTGFSMGGAFATIIATDIVYNANKLLNNHACRGTSTTDNMIPVTAFVFANSPVGDEDFSKVVCCLEFCNLRILRVKHEIDENPNTPTEDDGYFHVGKDLIIRRGVHNIKTYLSSIQDSKPKPSFICPNEKTRDH